MKTIFLFFSFLLLSVSFTFGQHEPETHDKHPMQHHRLALFTGYGLIPGAIDEEGNDQVKIIPVAGLDYEYWFNHKIAIGLQSDIELATYTIEQDHQEYLERNYAFVTSLVCMYEPIHGWAVFAGPGYEFEHEHNFALFKIGTEVAKIFEGGWSAGIMLSYDIKEVNSSLALGVSVGKRLGKFK